MTVLPAALKQTLIQVLGFRVIDRYSATASTRKILIAKTETDMGRRKHAVKNTKEGRNQTH